MKSSLNKLVAMIMLLAVVSACSVQKRRYTKGWQISRAASHLKTSKQQAERYSAENKPMNTHRANGDVQQLNPARAPETAAKPLGPVLNAMQTRLPAKTAAQRVQAHAMAANITGKAPTPHAFKPVAALASDKGSGTDNTDTFSVLSLVFAIVGTGILGIVFGVIAKNGYKQGNGKPDMQVFAKIGLAIFLFASALNNKKNINFEHRRHIAC